MARAAKMAEIQSYLAEVRQAEESGSAAPPINPDAANTAVGAPVPESTAAPEEKETAAPELTEDDNERASIKEMRQAQIEAKIKRQNQSETAKLVQDTKVNVQQTVSNAGSVLNRGKLALGNIPIPGDILLPLFILLLFFFALIPINGNTRLKWLWLAITGNASISASGGTPGAASNAASPFPALSLPALPSLSNSLTPLSGTSSFSLGSILAGVSALNILSHVEEIL